MVVHLVTDCEEGSVRSNDDWVLVEVLAEWEVLTVEGLVVVEEGTVIHCDLSTGRAKYARLDLYRVRYYVNIGYYYRIYYEIPTEKRCTSRRINNKE